MLDRAKEVLDIEAQAILSLRDRLDGGFTKAVELILGCKGHIIVTGIGKSGVIARKIAATLCSTGSPAIFLNAAEGVHGDLGVVTGNDLVILLSSSGETDEIKNILPVLKRLGGKLISITGKRDSTLAGASDVTLDASVKKEACPLGLAPTASTTAMLALGDALALTAMAERRFTAEDYAALHPGGSLGRRLTMTVEDAMRKGEHLAVAAETDTVKEVLFAITRAGAGAAAITGEGGKFIGIITDGDIRRHLLADEKVLSKKAAEIANRNARTITKEKLATEGLRILESLKIGELPVVDEMSRPIGMLMMKDLFRAGLV